MTVPDLSAEKMCTAAGANEKARDAVAGFRI